MRDPRGDGSQLPAVFHRLGQPAHGNVQQLAQGLIPAPAVNVKEHGPAAVGVVRGMDLSPGEIPQQPAVHRTAEQLSPLRPPPGAGGVLQQPPVFGAGEIGVRQQPGPGPNGLRIPLLPQLGAERRGPPALPDNGAPHRLAGLPLPHQRGFPLVGQPHPGNLTGPHAALGHALGRRPELAVQQLQRIVLHPAGLRIILREGNLCRRHH